MKWKFLQGVLFISSVLFLSTCGHDEQQPLPVETEIADSCISTLHPFPGNVITSLEKPVLSLPSDSLPYGTNLYIQADSVVKPGIVEISLDSGKVWLAAKCISLTKSGELWARRRYEEKSSPVTKAKYVIYYERILIVGNSITGHGPAPDLGWTGDWGMAASSAEKDYVHIISKKLRDLNPRAEIKLLYAVDFEQGYWKYDFSKLQGYAEFRPDLVIMRIAENTEMDHVNNYESSYATYVSTLTAKTNARVICTTSFWKNYGEVGYRIRNVANNRGYLIADLEPFWADKSYTAYNVFANAGVGSHPSDKGMKAIADCISKYF
jgi:hypothetical protein